MPDTTPTLSVANLVLRSKQQEIDALRHLAHKAEWVDAIGQLVQRLQRERGASCIYLASQTQRFAEVRHQAVNEALLHEEKLRQVFSEQMDPAQWPPPPPWLCGSTACRNGLCGNRRACLKTSAPCKTA